MTSWRHKIFLKSLNTWCHFRIQFELSLNFRIRLDSNRIKFKKKRNRFDLNRFLKLNSKVWIEFKSWIRNSTRRSVYTIHKCYYLKWNQIELTWNIYIIEWKNRLNHESLLKILIFIIKYISCACLLVYLFIYLQ